MSMMKQNDKKYVCTSKATSEKGKKWFKKDLFPDLTV